MSTPILLWLRNDLRLADHAALAAAVAAGGPVVPVFILDDAADGAWPRGGASRWWLHHTLERLGESYAGVGGRLILRRGDTLHHIKTLAAETGAKALYFTRSYEPAGIALEKRLKTTCDTLGLEVKRFGGALLREPEELRTKDGHPYKVYTPFWRALSADWSPARALAAPKATMPPRENRQRQARRLEAAANAAGLGRRHARRVDAGRGGRERSVCDCSSSPPSPATPRTATGQTCPAPRGSRRISISAKSVRVNAGTRRSPLPPASHPPTRAPRHS